jgi:hypothetical protein
MRPGEIVELRRARRQRHARALRKALAVILSVVWPLVAAACAGSTAGTARSDHVGVLQVAGHAQVALLPIMLGAGQGGWCLTTIEAGGDGCPTYELPARLGPFAGPIIAEYWTGRSAPVSVGPSAGDVPVDEAIVLTTREVMAVSLDGRAPVATHVDSALPDELRGADIELRGAGGDALAAPPPFPRSRFEALSAQGKQIVQNFTPGPPLTFELPSRSWGRGAQAVAGVCSLSVPGLAGLVSEGGSVMTVARPHPNTRGREFLSCFHASYILNGWPVEANILLDAAHPGARPGSLPAMAPLAGHPGIVVGPGAGGESVARERAGAWLVVAKGANLQQRLTVLEHLSIAIDLS